MKKKMIGITSIILLLMTTIGTSIVSAQYFTEVEKTELFSSFLNNEDGPTIDELIEIYNEIKQNKEEFRDLLDSNGIEFPELTKDQKQQIIQTLRQMRRNGCNRDEIKSEISDLLIRFGIDIPDLSIEQKEEIKEKIKAYLENNYNFVFIELSSEQKAYIRQTIVQLKRQGYNDEEIRIEVVMLYEGYGGNIPQLSDEEKEDIYLWIYSMIETDYDLELPDISYEERQEIKEKKDDIQQLRNELRRKVRQANWLIRFQFFRYVRNGQL